ASLSESILPDAPETPTAERPRMSEDTGETPTDEEGPDTYHPEMDPFAPMDPRLGLLQPVDQLSYRDTRHTPETGFREYRLQ
ncbi:MAG: hypothetical protein ACQESR_01420, partial [Planctomycetota bacterium]